MKTGAALATLLSLPLVTAMPAAARAQTRESGRALETARPADDTATAVVVVATELPSEVLEPDAARVRVARELQCTVVAPDAPEARTAGRRLTLTLVSPTQAAMVYRDASGREVRRVVNLPSTSAARLHALVLLAGNLARNEAQDLTRSLAPAPEEQLLPAIRPADAPQDLVATLALPVEYVSALSHAPVAPQATAPRHSVDSGATALTAQTSALDDRAAARRQYLAVHGGQLGLFATIGGYRATIIATSLLLTGFTAGASFRRDPMSIGAEYTQATGIDTGSSLWMGFIVGTAFANFGAFRIDVGLGVGLAQTHFEVTPRDAAGRVTSLPSITDGGPAPAGRFHLGLAYSIDAHFDLYTRVDVAGAITQDDFRQLSANLGIQARVFQ